jgi:hypothetical protein
MIVRILVTLTTVFMLQHLLVEAWSFLPLCSLDRAELNTSMLLYHNWHPGTSLPHESRLAGQFIKR